MKFENIIQWFTGNIFHTQGTKKIDDNKYKSDLLGRRLESDNLPKNEAIDTILDSYTSLSLPVPLSSRHTPPLRWGKRGNP